MEELIFDESEPKKRKGKKFGAKKSAIAVALAAILAVCGSVYKTAPHSINESVSEVVQDNKESTLFDEILDLDETIGITNIETGKIERVQVEDAIAILEERSTVNEKIDDLHLKKGELNELTDEAKKATIEFFNENGIDTMIELYKNKDNSKIDKARIAQQLLYIQEENEKWMECNGIPVSQSVLKRVISAGAIESYGTFKPEEYSVCDIDSENNGFIKEIVLVDPISGQKDKIVLLPIIAEEYYKALDVYQKTNSKNEFETDEIIKLVKNTLNITKRCINKELEIERLVTYTKKHK